LRHWNPLNKAGYVSIVLGHLGHIRAMRLPVKSVNWCHDCSNSGELLICSNPQTVRDRNVFAGSEIDNVSPAAPGFQLVRIYAIGVDISPEKSIKN
jgi:hypothetical protein